MYGLDGTLHYRDNITTGETTDYVRMGSHTVGRMDETDAFTWTHGDHLGSASAATNTAGNILWRESYTPFGEVLEDPSANRDEAGFTGHVRDAATGLTYAQTRYYNPVTARFLAPDPVGFAEAGWPHFNRYGYAYNDPVNATDPTGEIPVETVWDAANVGMGVASFTGNARSGNWGGAAVDAVGVVLDSAATLIPYVPGGAGAAIKGVRAGADAVQGARQAGRGPDFIVTSKGTAVSTSQSQMRNGFDAAGFSSAPTRSSGTEHTLPDGGSVRTMEASGQAPRRASFENSNGQPVDPDGRAVQPPKGLSRGERREYVRERTHVEQEP
jgi:RHS repeat-associated protein